MMKKLWTALTPLCLALCVCGCSHKQTEFKRGEGIFCEFSAEDLDGNFADASVFDGYKLTMVNVWATWCDPCKEEMPALKELDGEYKNAGFQVMGIVYDAVDRNYNKVQSAFDSALKVIADTGANYRHLIPSKSFKTFMDGIRSVPVTVFVDEDGFQIGETYVGAKSKAAWKKLIDDMLEFVSQS